MGLAGLTMAGFMLLSCNTEVKEANYQIIPLPQEISVMDQAAPFILSNGTKIMYPEGNEKCKRTLNFGKLYQRSYRKVIGCTSRYRRQRNNPAIRWKC